MSDKTDDVFCVGENGEVMLDWSTRDRDMVSVSLEKDGTLVWAWVKADKTHGHGVSKIAKEITEILEKVAREE
jgi:hypothetical protein